MNVFHKVTWQTLKQNRIRTIVTIIGILLSTAMMTAITTFVASMLRYAYDVTAYQSGAWHMMNETLTEADMPNLLQAEGVEQAGYAKRLGYAKIAEDKNEPYLYLLDGDEAFAELSGIHLVKGRFPQNGQELLISEHMYHYLKEVDWQIGDTVTLELGRRRGEDGEILWQKNLFQYVETEEGDIKQEHLEDLHTATFTIVGISSRPPFESWASPGFTALTKDSSLPASREVVSFFRFQDPHDFISMDENHIWYQSFFEKNGYPDQAELNYSLLPLCGYISLSMSDVLKGMGMIVLVIVGGASVALVYNAFAISVSERTRQFGLLSSIGATQKQLKKMVLFEACTVSAVGIPLGICSGLLGIGITLQLVGAKFANVLGEGDMGPPVRMIISPAAIGIAAVCALITVLLSAWIPCCRAARVSAVEAIRQNKDIKVSKRDVRNFPFTFRVFGIAGKLGKKYYCRSRKKYRSTVISLVMSILLFISTCSLTDYLSFIAGISMGTSSCDIIFSYYPYEGEVLPFEEEELEESIKQLSHVREVQRLYSYGGQTVFSDGSRDEGGLYFLPEEDWERLLAEHSLDKSEYNQPEAPLALAVEQSVRFDESLGKYVEKSTFEDRELAVTMQLCAWEESSESYREWEQPITIGKILKNPPWFAGTSGGTVELYYPEWAATSFQLTDQLYIPHYFIKAENHRLAMEQMKELIQPMDSEKYGLYDETAQTERNKNLLLIVHVFSYGFISLITLIAVANVFNTVSTNIGLRRREFAMLQTVGMSKRMFHSMLGYECFLYGSKALLYGLPLSMLAVYWIGSTTADYFDIMLRVPWNAVLISVIGVFAVVLCSMAYAVHKLKKENLIEVLKNENL